MRCRGVIKEPQDSANDRELPCKEEHYSSHTGGKSPPFTPSKQCTRHAQNAERDSDDIDDQSHRRYLRPNGERVKALEGSMSDIEMLQQLPHWPSRNRDGKVTLPLPKQH